MTITGATDADDVGRGLIGTEESAATRAAAADEGQWILERERVNGGPFWSRADGSIHAPAGFQWLLDSQRSDGGWRCAAG